MTPKVTWRDRDRSWRFHYRDANNERQTKSVPVEVSDKDTPTDEKKAQAWCDEWYATFLRQGRKAPTREIKVVAPIISFRSLHEQWLAYRESDPNTATTTYTQYESHTRNVFLKHRLADMPLTELTPRFLSSVIQSWTGASNTIANRCQSLSTFFRDARVRAGWVPDGMLPSNPMDDEIVRAVIPKREKRSGRINVHVVLDDARKLVCAREGLIPDIRRVKHIFAMYTGAREGEQQGAAWEHVHLDASIPYFDITRQYNRLNEFEPPKKDSFRQIPLHPMVVGALLWWRDVGWTRRVGRAPKPDDPVFPRTDGAYFRPNSARFVRDDLSKVGGASSYCGHNIDEQSLRRTFGTILTDAHVPGDVAGTLMGHAKKGVTDAHYIHRNLATFMPVIKLLDIIVQRRGRDSNPHIVDLQSTPWPLGYLAQLRGSTTPGIASTTQNTHSHPVLQTDSGDGADPSNTVPHGQNSAFHSSTPELSSQKPPQDPQPPQVTPSGLRGELDPTNPADVERVLAWLKNVPKAASGQ